MRTPAAFLLAALVILGCAAIPSSTPLPSAAGSTSSAPSGSGQVASSSAAAPETGASADLLLTVGFRGGHCRTGSCDRTLGIERDGSVHLLAPDGQELGTLPPELLQEVQEQLSVATFEELGSRPFTGECPVNFDGQELIYTFFADTGDIRLASCEVELDPSHPLLVAIENALASVPQP